MKLIGLTVLFAITACLYASVGHCPELQYRRRFRKYAALFSNRSRAMDKALANPRIIHSNGVARGAAEYL